MLFNIYDHFQASLADQLTEHNGQKLYVPVENPTITITAPPKPDAPLRTHDEDTMQLDDSKHKVYIYDLDAELSDSESDDGKLVFLPDIEKHLRETRIPPSILANADGELAGHNQQMVLYNIPSSLTVPEEKDSVRKAIIESRARARVKQHEERMPDTRAPTHGSKDSRDWYNGMINSLSFTSAVEPMEGVPIPNTVYGIAEDDPDAMDLG